jgi:hypothetical protein
MVGALEVPGIVAGPPPLTRRFAGFATIRLAAISLRLGVATARVEELFAKPAQTSSDALHDPAPSRQSSNIKHKQERKGLWAGRKQKNRVKFWTSVKSR